MNCTAMLRVACSVSTVYYIRHVIAQVHYFSFHALSRRTLDCIMDDKQVAKEGGTAYFMFPRDCVGAFARVVVRYVQAKGIDVSAVRAWHIADYMLNAVRADAGRQESPLLAQMGAGRVFHAGLTLAQWKSELFLAVDDVVVLRQGKSGSLSAKDNEEIYVGDYSDFEVPLALAYFTRSQIDDVLYAGLPLSCAEGYGKDARVLVAVLPRYPKKRRAYWKRRIAYENVVRVNA